MVAIDALALLSNRAEKHSASGTVGGRGALSEGRGMAGTKRGPVSKKERTEYLYRARLVRWGRPTPATAAKVCELVEVDPATLRAPRDRDDAVVRAAQAFTVALDTVIMAGDRSFDEEGDGGSQLVFNSVFDALARHWSLKYLEAQGRGAMISYDMAERTLIGEDGSNDGGVWRELRVAGVNIEAIWDLLTRQVAGTPLHLGLARLYTLTRVSGKGHSRGRKVHLHEGALLDDIRYVLLRDGEYARPVQRRLLLVDDKAPALPVHQDVCEERPYDLVNLNKRSYEILSILEAARVRFYVDQFREDFETLDQFVRNQPKPPYVQRAQRVGYERVVQAVRGLRSVYERTAGLADRRHEADGRGYVGIRSRFFRAVNRRFNAADFWPEHVPGDLRDRWFGVKNYQLPEGFWYDPDPDDPNVESEWVELESLGSQFIERDVSSSQTQILSVFLGEPDLEALATSQTLKFKCYLAQQLWALHERENVLAPGYTGPDDERLIAFIKEIWMRRNYGGRLWETVSDLVDDKATYGPGWNANIFKTGGGGLADQFFARFLGTLPTWSNAITKFLEAGQHIGQNADAHRGIIFRDPLDGAKIQWNPVRRATKKLSTGKRHLEVSLPGVLSKSKGGKEKRFTRRPWGVDTAELSNRVAPCLVHTLDAYFNALVIRYLHKQDIRNIVAIHDAWFVPRYVDSARTGAEVLAEAVESVGPAWLRKLGGIYDWFADSLKGSEYEKFAVEIRDRWKQRVAQRRWPRFTAA
jgi:hypothetical protein